MSKKEPWPNGKPMKLEPFELVTAVSECPYCGQQTYGSGYSMGLAQLKADLKLKIHLTTCPAKRGT